MASNETFVLDFKFNGNAEFLAKLESLMQRIDKTFNAVNDSAKDTEKSIDKMGDTAKDTTKSVDMMESSFGKLANTLGNVAKAYVGLQGLKKVWDFGMGSMDAYATQQKAEQQLRVVMRNQGTEDQFQGVLKEAANIQGRTIYGDEAMIAAAGELATYVKGAQSLKDMMNLLTDYAAGMTGGGAIDTQQMVGLATALGMAYDGNYRALRMKGFDTTQMQLLDALEKNGGNVTQSMINQFGVGTINDNAELIRQVKEYGQVTESMKIDALKESLSTWKGLAEEMNGLDYAAPIRLSNAIGDLRENIGKKLYPTFNKMVDSIERHLPDIERMFDSLGRMFDTIVSVIDQNMGGIIGIGEALGNVIKIMAEMPRASLAFGAAVMMVSRNMKQSAVDAASAAENYKKLEDGVTGASKSMKGLGMNAAMLVGTGVLSGATADIGEGKSDGENAIGVLGSVGMAAAFGAKQFGILGAAISATAASFAMFVKASIGAINASKEAAMTEKEINEKRDAKLQIIEFKKQADAGVAGAWINYERAYDSYKAKYGDDIDGAWFIKDLTNLRAAQNSDIDKAEKKASKSQNAQIYNSFNKNVTQNVDMAVDFNKAGILLNANLRALMEENLRLDRESSLVTEA